MTTIYRCDLTLLEPTFFSSREISNYYQTAPLIGNYALAYALGLCHSPYYNNGKIRYHEDLLPLNDQGVYVTPATLMNSPTYRLEQFNAQPDAYWYAMANNVIVTRPDGAWVQKRGSKWYVIRTPGERGKGIGLENRPQHGRIRFLDIGNQARFYLIGRGERQVPSYIRLGKFMSKARIEAEEVSHVLIEAQDVSVPFLLNPVDLAAQTDLTAFDLVNIPPTPLIRNGLMSGHFYQIGDETHLPAGMRFGIDILK